MKKEINNFITARTNNKNFIRVAYYKTLANLLFILLVLLVSSFCPDDTTYKLIYDYLMNRNLYLDVFLTFIFMLAYFSIKQYIVDIKKYQR